MLNYVPLLMLLIVPPAFAQQADWQTVREIKPGSRVEVILQDGKRVAGRFVTASAAELELDKGRSLATGRIYRVQIREKGSRWRGAMFGSLAGFAIGFVVGASNAGFLTDRNDPPATVRIGTGAGIGMFAAGIGAPIGALTGGHKYRTIYRAEKRR